MTVKKKKVLIILSVIFIAVAVISPFYYYNQIYARRLIAAIESGDTAKVERIAKQWGNINSRPHIVSFENKSKRSNQSPIYSACRSGDLEMVQILVENGANINVFDGKGRYPYFPLETALYYFPLNERPQIMEYLFENGLDIKQIESRDKSFWFLSFFTWYGNGTGNTAENEAIEYQIFSGFIAQGVEPKESDYVYVIVNDWQVSYKGNFLHITAEWDNVLITKYLIEELNFNADAVDSDGQTALIRTVIHNSKDMLEYLLSKGADKTIKDDSGKTALDYAIANESTELINLLS
jgi:hypothetical protein